MANHRFTNTEGITRLFVGGVLFLKNKPVIVQAVRLVNLCKAKGLVDEIG